MAEFADQATLRAEAGNGGNGCASIHREKFKPPGGPDGGNGGHGGDVILEVSRGATTLLDFHRRPLRRAGSGKQGSGSNRSGAAGPDLEIQVPDGTVVKTADGEVLADLIGEGTRFVAARGGRGGLGNAALASARRKAPGFALKGEPGERRDLVLELKTVADIGLIGFPNAGKSSLIAAMSAARPKIANYPFTTLIPNLGVVEAGESQFVAADVPGLIPGASEGRGLGLDFLRHVERCAALVHVLDCATEEPGRDPVTDMEVIEAELAAYEDATGASLADRPGFEVVRTGGNSFLIRGDRPRRWVLQTDFSNDEAVGYLADRLARLGVEDSLAELGAEPGAEVLIGDYDDAVVFDWDPELPAGSISRSETAGRGGSKFGPRGTDRRLSP